jgi:catechol 2,3-dioxygenase-like lactoylglutathione lyase family enzyme
MNHRPRGIDHVGLTVPDIEIAERFLIDGLGAELIYETLSAQDEPLRGPEIERVVRLPAGAEINLIRMYKMGTGPGIELFQYTVDDQRPPARGSDLGWQHVALYVDDLEECAARAIRAGAVRLNLPWNLMNAERGDGNRFCFVSTPFGALLELVTFPSPQAYESTTLLRRWKPPSSG